MYLTVKTETGRDREHVTMTRHDATREYSLCGNECLLRSAQRPASSGVGSFLFTSDVFCTIFVLTVTMTVSASEQKVSVQTDERTDERKNERTKERTYERTNLRTNYTIKSLRPRTMVFSFSFQSCVCGDPQNIREVKGCDPHPSSKVPVGTLDDDGD